jgi:hypothetical protein
VCAACRRPLQTPRVNELKALAAPFGPISGPRFFLIKHAKIRLLLRKFPAAHSVRSHFHLEKIAMADIWSTLGRLLEYTQKKTLTTPSSKANDFIKIVHSEDIKSWTNIPSYEELATSTLSDYLSRREELAHFRKEIPELIEAKRRKDQINTSDLEEYAHFDETVPRDLLRRDYIIRFKNPIYEKTEFKTSDGKIEGRQLNIKRGWKKRVVRIKYVCPSSEAHKDEIQQLNKKIENASEGDKWKFDRCMNSVFNHPVLFISHRWESSAHPDPNGKQLEKLSRLKNCFVIYDYFSFPQNVQIETNKAKLDKILEDMTSILCNVIILASDAYIDRGWCLYEYLMASLKEELVCDEVGAKEFVKLRDVVGTRIPPSFNIFKGDSFDASLNNSKSEQIIAIIDSVLPKFQRSNFTIAADRLVVKNLLVNGLLHVLPKKQSHTPYIGFQESDWSRSEIEGAFTAPINYQSSYSTKKLKPKKLPVYDDLDSAVKSNYIINQEPVPKNEQELFFKTMELVEWN